MQVQRRTQTFARAKKYNIAPELLNEEYLIKRKSQSEIAKLLGVSQWVISQRMRKSNLITRKKTWRLTEQRYCQKYPVNIHFFDVLTPKNAWVLGWISSDGFINKNKESHAFGLKLNKKDIDVLIKIKNLIGYAGPILEYKTFLKKTNKNYSECLLKISNKRIVKRLEELGICSNKSQNERFPIEIKVSDNEALIKNFIKGFFEGDGSIIYTKNSLLFQIVGTKEILRDIQYFLMRYLMLNKTKLTRNILDKNHWALRYRGNKQTIKIFDWLYSDNELCLNRKYNKYLQIKEELKK
ncbi:hypothetical protein A3K73_01685 [Candidatus Pacearchaeota archaeon RBG_13_36_9]|nr:MAG: hypothetical protein A3K73_01685 [Candidatus Pacearchaeota archaeon RBG_13_36_9]